jgi:AcrR family transcriptional regulator
VAYRPTERTESRRLAARDQIVRAALELIAADGYRAAPIAAVAGRAGVATGTVYRHFPSKADLFAEVFRSASQHEVDAVTEATSAAGTAPERIAAAVEIFTRRALRGRRLAWALIAEPVDPAVEAARLEFRRAYAAAFAAAIRAGIAAGELPDQDADLAATCMVGAIGEALVGPTQHAGMERQLLDEDALVEGLVRFCLRSITDKEPHRVHLAA